MWHWGAGRAQLGSAGSEWSVCAAHMAAPALHARTPTIAVQFPIRATTSQPPLFRASTVLRYATAQHDLLA